MSSADPLAERARGYVSEDSKRRFTLVAGILGAAVFIGADHAAGARHVPDHDAHDVTRQELKVADARPVRLVAGPASGSSSRPRASTGPTSRTRSRRRRSRTCARPTSSAPALPWPSARPPPSQAPALLATGARLWIVGEHDVRYYEDGAITTLAGTGRPPRASHPFAYGGAPARRHPGTHRHAAHAARAEATQAEWVERELSLDLPTEMRRAARDRGAGGRRASVPVRAAVQRVAPAVLDPLPRARGRRVAVGARGVVRLRMARGGAGRGPRESSPPCRSTATPMRSRS